LESKRKGKSQAVDVQGLLSKEDGEGDQVDVLRLSCFACGQLHPASRLVRLPDGRAVGSYSDEFRVYCEAKWVFRKFRSKRTRQLYLKEVARMRGEAGYAKLYAAMLDIWKRKQGQ
jgi:hypothetical protein